MSRKSWNDIVDRARREHRDPPPAPRERLWERIDATRAPQRRRTEDRRVPTAVWGWPLAAAAVLAAALLAGPALRDRPQDAAGDPPRVARADTSQAPATAPAPAPRGRDGNPLYDRLTLAVLDRADALLTDFRSRDCAGVASPEGRETLKTWAGSLLSETRLMLDTPVTDDPELRPLFRELELVLAQLSSLSDTRCEDDSAWIVAGMDRRDTLERLRTVAAARRDRIAL